MDKTKLRRLLIGEFTLKRFVKSCIFVYICIALFAYLYSGGMLFHPPASSYIDESNIIKIDVADSEQISALYLSNPEAEFTILYSHGNAEDLGELRPILERFYITGYSILAYDYRGYGTSDGIASEKNTYEDVEAAYKYLTAKAGVLSSRIVAAGRSVGGGVAINLACRKKIGGLILESSFVTAFRVVTRIPLLPFDKFRNIDKIKKINCPVLVVHGQDDGVIGVWHGKKLFEKANEPKFCLWVDNAGHNEDLAYMAGSSYWNTIEKFMESVKTGEKNPILRQEFK
jgi:fermentation-respiration switch protein FrsA (DUF1100 family)